MSLTLPDGEPAAGPWRLVAPSTLLDLFQSMRRTSGRAVGPLVVAVDGRGGGGKSTVSGLLAAAAASAAIVHTDDIAWHEPLFAWGELLTHGVLEPLRRGERVDFRPPAWAHRGRSGSIRVDPDVALVVIEGVGAAQRIVDGLVDVVVWVQSDFVEAERRGIARDVAAGENGDEAAATAFWHEWMAAELAFQAEERPWERAAIIVCGTSPDASGEGILIADGPSGS